MACTDNISNRCADPILTTCVDHEGALGENTKIVGDCANQSDINIDLYAITDETIAKIDVSALASTCITIPPDSSIADIVALYETKICELNTEVTTLKNINYSEISIDDWGLTIPACIADSCANPPTTLGPLVQAIMNNRNCT